MLALSAASLLYFWQGWPVLVLVWIVWLRYCFTVLERTAYGVLSPHERYDGRYRSYRPWKQIVILLLAGLLIWLVAYLAGDIAGYVTLYGLMLLLPANIMWLARTNSLFSSLNPMALRDLIGGIGWPYLALCGFLAALSAASNAAMMFLVMVFGFTWWLLPALSFIGLYFTLIMYNMMGYTLYQYHDELGVRPLHEPAAQGSAVSMRRLEHDPAALDAYLQRLAVEGRVEDAVPLLARLVRRQPDQLPLHERYHLALAATGRTDATLEHAPQYIALLLADGQVEPALRLFRECAERRPGFGLHDPAAQLQLARAARRQGDPQFASTVLRDFDQRFPGSAMQGDAYYLAAQLLHEDFHESGEARRLLEFVLRQYPNDPIADAARRYLAGMPLR
jgi:tetratricopeptide (TPR) repeat protein